MTVIVVFSGVPFRGAGFSGDFAFFGVGDSERATLFGGGGVGVVRSFGGVLGRGIFFMG